jgi:hypothetical protein
MEIIERDGDSSFKAVRIREKYDVTITPKWNGKYSNDYTLYKRVRQNWEPIQATSISGTGDPLDLKVVSRIKPCTYCLPRWNGSAVNVISREKWSIDFYGPGGYFTGPGDLRIELEMKLNPLGR